uniref:Uncharacterized protein n=1 Tax=Solanum tuberosum TaxID=4113 RepID=M1DPP5_SOLTU
MACMDCRKTYEPYMESVKCGSILRLQLRLANGQDRINRTGFTGNGPRYRISLPEPVLPEISKGSVRSLSYRIGTGLDRTGTDSYRIIVYQLFNCGSPVFLLSALTQIFHLFRLLFGYLIVVVRYFFFRH